MKLVVALACCFISINGFSQSLRLSGIALIHSSENISGIYNNGSSYTGTIKAGLQWGGGVEYLLDKKYGIEFSFQQQKTTLPLSYKIPYETGVENHDLNLGWMMLKCNRYFGQKTNKLQGFAGIGAGIVMVKSGRWGATTGVSYFGMQANAGIIYWLIKPIGIKLSGQYQLSPKGTGDVFMISYLPTSEGLKSSSSISQFGLGLGIVIVLDGLANSN